MQTSYQRHIAIAGTYNIRDLGGYRHAGGTTRWRSLYRGDSLHRLDEAGMAELKSFGVRTVIDLRRDEELKRQPNPFRGDPDITYRNISLFDPLAPTAMTGGVALHDIYIRALGKRGSATAEVLKAIADAPEGAVLFHCTAGKDRTGLIAALLLALAEVDSETIVSDYALTEQLIEPAIEGFIADAVARGLELETFRPVLSCKPETMSATLAHLIAAHSSVGAYLASIGVSSDTIARIRARLIDAAEKSGTH